MDYIAFDRLCREKHTTPTALALQLGLSKGNTSSWKKGGNPSADILIKIADELNCTVDLLLGRTEKSSSAVKLDSDEQLLIGYFKNLSDISKGIILGRAEQLAELEKPVAYASANEIEPEESRLKINCSTYQVSAGAGFELGEGDEWYEIEVPDTSEARKADFALQIKGNSMEPIYFDGDIVLVKKQPSVNLGQIGIFSIEGNGYIKKFGGDRLISLNDEYDDIKFSDYDEERIRCFGKVIGRV